MNAHPSQKPVIVWFREDLRLNDNPALYAAAETGAPVIPLFILDDETDGLRQLGGASRWWLHHSINSLAGDIEDLGGQMIVRRGPSAGILSEIVSTTGADHIFWNRRYGRVEIDHDKALKAALQERNVAVKTFNARLLYEPWTIATKSGTPFKVFTPFWKAARTSGDPGEPLPGPENLPPVTQKIRSDRIEDWDLDPREPDWAAGFKEVWRPGETGARQRLAAFLTDGIGEYAERRDEPAAEVTSRLSPHLAFGEISPRQIRASVDWPGTEGSDRDKQKFLSEIGWREFSYHLLYHFPDLATVNIQDRFDRFEWNEPGPAFDAWTRGQTGYPLVDAAMRQLWQTGWMHNRCRMIVGSFLVKHLLVHWHHGEDWFWDTLVDADPANNPAGWQWIAGSGADAAPYYRIFNPILQSRKFDPEGRYIRTFCPELAKLDNDQIHEPWTVPPEDLEAAGIVLGKTYPRPVVDHKQARERALAAFRQTASEPSD
jgi:deoxyribodipyrimidine photo-lyase